MMWWIIGIIVFIIYLFVIYCFMVAAGREDEVFIEDADFQKEK